MRRSDWIKRLRGLRKRVQAVSLLVRLVEWVERRAVMARFGLAVIGGCSWGPAFRGRVS